MNSDSTLPPITCTCIWCTMIITQNCSSCRSKWYIITRTFQQKVWKSFNPCQKAPVKLNVIVVLISYTHQVQHPEPLLLCMSYFSDITLSTVEDNSWRYTISSSFQGSSTSCSFTLFLMPTRCRGVASLARSCFCLNSKSTLPETTHQLLSLLS